ncbi:PadR family transcriptional regulator [Amycolatopsis sp.]|uniref:PadR family transcriptional regulator n=1 Tax=Amycolatopsis sp. TaxID=37632 RepID=UPI002BCC2AB6|nr:PadR family transcriptional regulator [Amycolatopsis sp.]HVV09802.1 PadR family transcriptional regulator [Amycolatopsis sp.]
MSLRHALLALLDAGPMTGYELAKQFDQSAERVWHAPHPQIYTELRRLEAEEFVVADERPRGTKAVKRAYRITGAGGAELRRWVSEVETPQRVRDVAYLKATYFEYIAPETVRRQFELHKAHHQEQLQRWERHVAQLRAHETELLQRRLASAPESRHEAIVAYKVHVYEGMAARARTEIEWAERGLGLVADLEG